MKPGRVNKPRLALAASLVLLTLFALAMVFRGYGKLEPPEKQATGEVVFSPKIRR